jgi:hypothetical protein
MRALIGYLMLCWAAAGCDIPGPEAIKLSASVRSPALAIEQLTLGTRLSGGFELYLAVGSEASGASTVSLESFGVVRASDQSALVVPLSATPQDAQFPLEVPKGSQRVVPFLIEEGKWLDAAGQAALCAEPVQIVGAIRDTLSGGEVTALGSPALIPSGC